MGTSQLDNRLSAQAHCNQLAGWEKDEALARLLSLFRQQGSQLIEAVEKDRAAALRARMSISVQQRLAVTSSDLERWADLLERAIKRPDPSGEWSRALDLDSGHRLAEKCLPCGPIRAAVFQHPERLWRILLAALRTGNSLLLIPGLDMLHTAQALQDILEQWQRGLDWPADWVSLRLPRDSKDEEALLAEAGYGLTILTGPEGILAPLRRIVSGSVVTHFERKETLWILSPPGADWETLILSRLTPGRQGAANLLVLQEHEAAWKGFLRDLSLEASPLSLENIHQQSAWNNPDTPVLSSLPDEIDEALAILNPLGLSAVSVWTEDYDLAHSISGSLEAPCVQINGLLEDLVMQADKERLIWGLGHQAPLAYGLLDERIFVRHRSIALDRNLAR